MDDVGHSKAAVQLAMLVNLLSIGSLMMVMPLGPDLVRHLGMQANHVGYISGGATLAAALSMALAAPWLDRLNRKQALVSLLTLRFALLIACALAGSAEQLILLFVLSGLVAGPMGALLMASMLDVIAPTERGRKLAYIGMGFSLAAIVVVPLALELALRWGWQAPFIFFGGLGLVLALLCHFLLHIPVNRARPTGSLLPLLKSPLCLGALAITALQLFGHFLLVPHLSNYFQFNLHFPREQIGSLFLCGGLASLAAMRLGGSWIDRGQAPTVILLSSGGLALTTLLGFAIPSGLSIYLIFVLFMAASAVRTNSSMTLAAAIPPPHQRAAFMAFQGTVSNVAAGLGSLFSALYLSSGADNQLQGFNRLSGFYVVAGILTGVGMCLLLRGIQRRDAASHSAGITTQAG
ncbi:MFS transporter [Pseudomonas sp. sp1636]|uniref:MFS transporter n=1 Tax=Pseudomonas sp. sp1636 TaxID=3036707 RepID=UPI0025A5A994|nr:MFS transporter [Pseudomonas sp. sp1636]MDM8350646.1 MFS transporter [Pseudomonas sp. sp1636]